MLQVEGYKMFVGTMLITPINPFIKPLEITGTWLYKPEYNCWYCGGANYPENICKIIEDKTICKK